MRLIVINKQRENKEYFLSYFTYMVDEPWICFWNYFFKVFYTSKVLFVIPSTWKSPIHENTLAEGDVWESYAEGGWKALKTSLQLL